MGKHGGAVASVAAKTVANLKLRAGQHGPSKMVVDQLGSC